MFRRRSMNLVKDTHTKTKSTRNVNVKNFGPVLRLIKACNIMLQSKFCCMFVIFVARN